MKVEWNLDEFMGYLHTWSATQRFQKENEQNPLDIVYRLLVKARGDPETRHAIRWPLYLRLGKVSAL